MIMNLFSNSCFVANITILIRTVCNYTSICNLLHIRYKNHQVFETFLDKETRTNRSKDYYPDPARTICHVVLQ